MIGGRCIIPYPSCLLLATNLYLTSSLCQLRRFFLMHWVAIRPPLLSFPLHRHHLTDQPWTSAEVAALQKPTNKAMWREHIRCQLLATSGSSPTHLECWHIPWVGIPPPPGDMPTFYLWCWSAHGFHVGGAPPDDQYFCLRNHGETDLIFTIADPLPAE